MTFGDSFSYGNDGMDQSKYDSQMEGLAAGQPNTADSSTVEMQLESKQRLIHSSAKSCVPRYLQQPIVQRELKHSNSALKVSELLANERAMSSYHQSSTRAASSFHGTEDPHYKQHLLRHLQLLKANMDESQLSFDNLTT